nr:transcription factor tau 55 kda subunit [Quercus suber]
MGLEVIYVVRHGVDPQTGEYSATVKSPTGIPSDPALASYGVHQAEQLGSHLLSVKPPVDLIYSSPFYRCLQTLAPFTNILAARADAGKKFRVNIEPGLGEFYGLARFDHPSPASIDVLNTHFPNLYAEEDPIIVPSTKGESIPQLHDRLAYALHHLIARADMDPSGPKSLLICSHAAAMISIGRVLTGRMPANVGEQDFKCFTCSFSKFVRKAKGDGGEVQKWNPETADQVPDVHWRDGKGVQGGWSCEVNGDCSFLTDSRTNRNSVWNARAREWPRRLLPPPATDCERDSSIGTCRGHGSTSQRHFSGDESFLKDPNAFNDTANTIIGEARPSSSNESGSRL